MFVRIVRNFCNVITIYRDSKYFKQLIRILRQHFSSSNFVTFSHNSNTSSKFELSQELRNSFAKISRISRRNKFIINIENVFIRFDLRFVSSQTSSYSSVINSFFRRVTSVTFADEIIHYEFIESQSARNMIDFIVKQQRIIAIIVRKTIQIIFRKRDDDDDDVELFNSFDFFESFDQNDNIDNNIK